MNLKQLSEILGLSQTTVSRALNGYPEVAERTRLRVQHAAQKHNYQPNIGAQRLARGRSMTIGHVIPLSTQHEMVNPVFADFIAGAGERYSACGYDMKLTIVDDQNEEDIYRDLKSRGSVDGIIVHGPLMNDPRIPLLQELDLPFVVHGRASDIDTPYCWVDVNNASAFQRAGEFLLSLGHRRIGLINGLEHMDFAHRRRAGLVAALESAGVTPNPDYLHAGEMTEINGHDAMKAMLALDTPPTAVVVASFIAALGVRRALDEAGLRMARDVSVITFDDDLSYLRNGDSIPIFTATRSSVRQAGRLSADLLISHIENPTAPPEHKLLEADLIIGNSTGPVPQEQVLMKFKRSDFPRDFMFGAATSSYQIEGHSFGGAGPTHWDSFAATPGNVVRAEHGAIACDHYNRFEEDLDLMKAAGFDAYRFSTSWARVMPEGRGTPNPEGLDFYDRLTDAMLERGLKPCATLYHWELPSALADMGGWRNADIAKWFGDFTEVIMGRIGDRMHSVAPINEPWCVGWLSHFIGAHAPGLRDIRATARAMHHVLTAHGTAIQVMRGLGMENLGGVFNMEWPIPQSGSEEDYRAAQVYDGIYNRFFVEGIFNRRYPETVLEGLEPHLPHGWQDDFDLIAQPLDWVGLNYYTCKRIAAAPGTPWPHLSEHVGGLTRTQMGWEIYPQGLGDFVRRMHRENTGDLPIYITENGMANNDHVVGGEVNDSNRIAYLDDHLTSVREAIEDGAPVRGYFCWSLLDNYEWSLGYEKRFGLVHVDFESLKRTPKASYEALRLALSQ